MSSLRGLITVRTTFPATTIVLALALQSSAAEPRAREVWMEVAIRDGHAMPAGPSQARVIARPVGLLHADGAGTNRDLRQFEEEVAIPGRVSFRLPRGVLWTVRLDAPDYWSDDQIVAVPDAGDDRIIVAVDLVPIGRINGSAPIFEVGSDEAGDLLCSFRPAADSAGNRGGLGLESWKAARISVDGARFRCGVPSGKVHFKLHLAGHVPHYFWDVEVARTNPVEVGEIQFRKGVSLTGEVRIEGPAPTSQPRVSLLPARIGSPSPIVEERMKAMAASDSVDLRGFFQIEGIRPGSYGLVVEAEGFAATRHSGLDLLREGEYLLADPLVLRPPSELEVAIDPPVHPYGVPWSVELVSTTDSNPGTVAQHVVEAHGIARFTSLAPGAHEVFVVGPEGSRYAVVAIDLYSGRHTERIELPLVEVGGELRIGEEPLAGTLLFGGRDAKKSVVMEADREGLFLGHLPHAGRWDVDVQHPDGWVQRVAPIDVPEDEERLELVISLPDGEVSGQVLDEAARAVANAVVLVLDSRDRRPALRGMSGIDGSFYLRGLASGSYFVYAENNDGSSPWRILSLREGEHRSDEKLVIERRRRVRGKVLSTYGPLPGARVDVLPELPYGAPAWVAQDVTGPDGGFSVDLPRAAVAALVVVHPPGHAWTVRRIELQSVASLEIPVEAEGGLLLLSLPQDGGGMLRHSGAELPIDLVRDWARARGVDGSSEAMLRVPDVEPGEYTLCSRQVSEESRSGDALPACSSGYVAPGGLLALATASDAQEEVP